MKHTVEAYLTQLGQRYPELMENGVLREIEQAYFLLENSYRNGGKLLVCGNGGSCSDSEHIVGELMKSFLKKRPISEKEKNILLSYGEEGHYLSEKLEGTLRAVALTSHPSLATAVLNDTDGKMIFAQQVNGLGDPGDILLALSTSGNSADCVFAAITAKALGMKVIAMTGISGGKLAGIADVTIKAPSSETYMVQEYHLPIYHCLCCMLEEEFF